MDPSTTLTYRIKGSGIRGYEHHKDKWDAKRNTSLEVKPNESKCLRFYADQNTDAGSIAKELQDVLRTFLESKPWTEIKAIVTSLKAVLKVQGKGKELPCDIFLTGEDTPAVRNDIRAIQEEVKALKKKDKKCYKDLKITKMPTRKKAAGKVKAEETAEADDTSNVNDNVQEENVENGTNDRPEINSRTDGANTEVDDRNRRTELNSVADGGNDEVDGTNGMPEVNSVADSASNARVDLKNGKPELISVADGASNAGGDHKNGRPELISVADGASNAGGDHKNGRPELISVADSGSDADTEQNINNSNNFGTKRKQISNDNSQADEPICKSIKTTKMSATQSQLGVDDECDAFHIRVINKNLSPLLNDLDPLPTLDAFLENEYITEIKARDITDLKIRSEQIRAILDIVKRKGPNGYDTFKSCLRKSNQEHLAVALERTEMELTNEQRTVPKASTLNASNEVQ